MVRKDEISTLLESKFDELKNALMKLKNYSLKKRRMK